MFSERWIEIMFKGKERHDWTPAVCLCRRFQDAAPVPKRAHIFEENESTLAEIVKKNAGKVCCPFPGVLFLS